MEWDGDLQKTSHFRYDSSNQLIEEWDGEQQTCYGYDQAGNRIWQEQGEASFVFAYNARNQLISWKGRTESTFYQYDKQGNLLEELTGEKRKQYQYDAQNRQQEVLQADGTFQKTRYDVEGLRAELEENGRLCQFIFHQGEIVSEERDGVAAVSRYLRGHGVEYLEQDEEQFPVLKDEQSSTVFLLNREHEIQNHYEYDAFGQVKESTARIENRILYTGQQYDGVAEQYYLRARYYNPVIGRFIQEDLYRGDGLNLYAYCGNNPVKYYDPSGYSGDLNCPGVGFQEPGKTPEYNQDVYKAMQDRYDYYKKYLNYDCSEIAEDFYKAANGDGKIYNILPKNSELNELGMDGLYYILDSGKNIFKGYEYEYKVDYLYHQVYSDGVYIYDPRFSMVPVLKDDYFRALKEINPSGFNVYELKQEEGI